MADAARMVEMERGGQPAVGGGCANADQARALRAMGFGCIRTGMLSSKEQDSRTDPRTDPSVSSRKPASFANTAGRFNRMLGDLAYAFHQRSNSPEPNV